MKSKNSASTSMLSATHMTPLVRRLSIEEVSLKVVDGPHKGVSLRFDQELLLVGRGGWCDLPLPSDRKVSKEHCELQLEEAGVRVRDLGSRNGITIDHIRVSDAWLPLGSRLLVGNSAILLEKHSSGKELQVPFHDKSNQLVGQSPKMRRIFSLMSRLSAQEIPVLLTGETGTGKTSVAKALHAQSTRKDGPFVAVNCGALAATLIESLFFGHEKGAFTGADKRHRGFFEQAHGGTLFLDELGELPLALQPKLLNVLESHQLQRLGSEAKVDVNFGLICATNRILLEEVAQKRFRRDLYYRVAVVELEIPPLRERPADIPLLAQRILQTIEPEQPYILSDEAIKALQAYIWPGNVRQLHNVLQRVLALMDRSQDKTDGQLIELDELALSFPESHHIGAGVLPHTDALEANAGALLEGHDSLKALLEAIEKSAIAEALAQSHGDTAAAAVRLGISRVWLYNRIKKHALKVGAFGQDAPG